MSYHVGEEELQVRCSLYCATALALEWKQLLIQEQEE